MAPQRKALRVEFKQGGPEGAFDATFSVFNVVDLDGDVTLPGAFDAGAKARITQYAHNWGVYTIGKGVLQADGERCWMSGQFNLKTTAGRDHYESVKDAEDLQQWSYGYDATDYSVDPKELARWPGAKRILKKLVVHEVSPVMLGAGIGTRTDAIKAKGQKQVPLSDEDKREEIQAAIAAINGGDLYSGPYVVATFSDLQYVIVRDYEAGKFFRVNYTIDANGTVAIGEQSEVEQTWVPKALRRRISGKAHLLVEKVKAMPGIDPATLATIAQIDLLADELDELVDTLMDQFEIPDPDELLEGEPEEPAAAAAAGTTTKSTFRDHAKQSESSERQFIARAKALVALRAKEGRVLSKTNWEFLASHADTLETQISSLRKLLEEHAPATDPKAATARQMRMKSALGETASRLGYRLN